MEFGLVLQSDPPASGVVAAMREAENLGFSYGWTFDSHVLWQEPFVIYSQILAATSTLTVGPMVTNPLTRDWSVIASLFATLNDMFGNRTVCGIGRGASSRRVLGQQPASLATLGEAMRVIKDLAEGREAMLAGTAVQIPWVRDGTWPRAARRCWPAPRSRSRGCATASWRSGWPPTGRRRCGWPASRLTGSSCRPPTPTSPG